MVRRKKRGSGPERGFTLIELAIAITIAASLVVSGVMYIGRVVVDDRDALHTVEESGLLQPHVKERFNSWPKIHGCGYTDAVAFVIEGTDKDGNKQTVNLCCGSWFQGCKEAEAIEKK